MSNSRINGVSGNLSVKVPARVATTGAITLSGEQAIDGVSVVEGDRVLVKDQADTTINGVYVVATGTWARALDFDGNNDVVDGTFFLVKSGLANTNTYWRVVSSDNKVVIGTSLVTFTQIFLGLGATLSSLQESDFMLWSVAGNSFINKTIEQVKTALGISDGDAQTTWKVKRFVSGVDFTPGVTTQLSLDSAPGSGNNCFIFFQGAYQEKPEFGVSGTTITFSESIPVGIGSVEVVHGSAVSVGVPDDGTITTAKLGALSVTYAKLATSVTATLSDLIAGTVSKLVNSETLKTYIDSYVLKKAVSDQQVCVANTVYTFTHTLGKQPLFTQLWAVCVTDNNGYVVGDKIPLSAIEGQSSVYFGQTTCIENANTTEVRVHFGAVPYHRHKTADTNHVMTMASWEFYLVLGG